MGNTCGVIHDTWHMWCDPHGTCAGVMQALINDGNSCAAQGECWCVGVPALTSDVTSCLTPSTKPLLKDSVTVTVTVFGSAS